MHYANTTLGRYAILQYDVATQAAEYHQTQRDKHGFFARFSITPALTRAKIKKPVTETNRLKSLVVGAENNLFVAKTVFPFVLSADTIKIDRQKITIVHNDFLWKSQTASTEIKNIMNVQTSIGPLFGSITVTSKHFLNNTQTISYLKRKDVVMAQRLLQGFMIAQRSEIDTDNIDKERLLALLNNLGQEN